MDKAFSEDKKRKADSEDDILVDYGFVSEQSSLLIIVCLIDISFHLILINFSSITGYIDPVDQQPQQETKYLKQALYSGYETQREILLHPLVQLFIARKWQKLIWIIGMWVFWQVSGMGQKMRRH
jgi:hypothetical protein